MRSELGGTNVNDEFRELITEYSDVFRNEIPDELPPRRNLEFEIHTEPGARPPVRSVIRLSTEELKELKRQLAKLLEKGLIRPSASPFGAPVFFVRKKSGDLRLVCDYRALNKITVSDATPLPLINEALDQVAGATIFSSIDLLWGFHQMRIRDQDIHKTAIRTRFGSYEWTVMCFGLKNAPAAFSRLISHALSELNGECVVLFIDDILVYSKSVEEHKLHLRRVLEVLRANKLYANPQKCTFGVDELDYLGHNVSAKGVSMSTKLVDAILDWPRPQTVRDVQSFMGLANFYRRFIRGYAHIMQPISDIVRENKFKWDELCTDAFSAIKAALTNAPVLAHPSSEFPFTVTTDASKYAVGATLEQNGHPVAYLSHRLSEQETRWDTGDQELLGLMIALREWNVYLRGRRFAYRTDHEPIRYLQTKARLSGRQARWLDELLSYDFEIEHVPGKSIVVQDALSRRADHALNFKQLNLMTTPLIDQIKSSYTKDETSIQLINSLENNAPVPGQIEKTRRNHVYNNGLLLWTASETPRVLVPKSGTARTEILRMAHGHGHLGTFKTFNKIAADFYWPRLYDDTRKHVSHCHECQTNKLANLLPAGKLQPHEIPFDCWDVISADFLTELPTTNKGNDAILVVVDKFSKTGIFIPTRKTATAPEVFHLFDSHVFSKHGFPMKIISDRDPKFSSTFWRGIMEIINTRLNLSSADHPETDGQAENLIRTLSGMLRNCIQRAPKDWEQILPTLEFEYNTSKHISTGLTPFEVNTGRRPKSPEMRSLDHCNIKCQSSADEAARREAFRTIARDNMARSREAQRYYADKGRRPQTFKVGSLVMLDARSLDATKRSSLPAKWRPKFFGPLRIMEVMGPVTYKIELPPSMRRAHNVFHVSKLRRYNHDGNGNEPLPIVIDADGTIEQEVSRILQRKKFKRQWQYLVLVAGDPESEAVWIPRSELKNCMDLVRAFDKSTRTSNPKRRRM